MNVKSAYVAKCRPGGHEELICFIQSIMMYVFILWSKLLVVCLYIYSFCNELHANFVGNL